MNFFNRAKLYYTKKEIADHLGVIADLNKQRDKLMQQIVFEKSDVKQDKLLTTLNLIDDNILTAHKSLKHMLNKNLQETTE